MQDVDPKALKILLDYYNLRDFNIWDTKHIDNPEFEYAKEKGLMFDKVYMTHDQAVDWLISIKDLNTKEKITDLFVSSLSKRQLPWRSGLSAYAISRHYPVHKYDPNNPWSFCHCCDVCGDLISEGAFLRNFSIYNLARHNSGGWSRNCPNYPADLGFYLSEMSKIKHIKPTSEDIAILHYIFDYISNTKDIKNVVNLEKGLAKVKPFKSNVAERRALLETLSFCSILETKDHQGYLNKFHVVNERDQVPKGSSESQWNYPIKWWTGSDGINEEAWNYWFGNYKF